MATPHVAGIAALLAEQNPALRGQPLRDKLIETCLALAEGDLRRGEVGKGMAQAPS
jgi:subtilisin family serine protease